MQPNAVTIQEELESSLRIVAGIEAGITGCGRTDTGVHARVFYAHFDVDEPIRDLARLAFRLDRFLPPSIAIRSVFPVSTDLHSRYSAIWREYRYTITREKDPFLTEWAYHVPGKLDVLLMNEACKILIETEDFECFSKVRTQVSNFRCRILEAEFTEEGHVLLFRIRADRFLRNMVRAIVGTMIQLGRHKLDLVGFKSILESKIRSKAGMSVPARGLVLWDVRYPEHASRDVRQNFSNESHDKVVPHHDTDPQFHDRSGNETYE
jgi:tRNA pseudouridine38-40 synthase